MIVIMFSNDECHECPMNNRGQSKMCAGLRKWRTRVVEWSWIIFFKMWDRRSRLILLLWGAVKKKDFCCEWRAEHDERERAVINQVNPLLSYLEPLWKFNFSESWDGDIKKKIYIYMLDFPGSKIWRSKYVCRDFFPQTCPTVFKCL